MGINNQILWVYNGITDNTIHKAISLILEYYGYRLKTIVKLVTA